MLMSLLALLLIIYNVYRGYQSGLVTEVVRVLSYLIAFLVALRFSRPVGSLFQSVNPHGIVDGLAFLAIFIVVLMFLRSLGAVLGRIVSLPVFKQLDHVGGAVLGGLIGYLLVFLILSVGLMLPSQTFRQQYAQSSVSQTIVNQTPGVTHHFTEQWLK